MVVTHNDPSNYAKMAVPFKDSEAANKAITAFYAELLEIREKHRMMDVLCVIRVAVGGGIGMTHSAIGAESCMESLAAYAYGATRANRERQIHDLMGGKTESLKDKENT